MNVLTLRYEETHIGRHSSNGHSHFTALVIANPKGITSFWGENHWDQSSKFNLVTCYQVHSSYWERIILSKSFCYHSDENTSSLSTEQHDLRDISHSITELESRHTNWPSHLSLIQSQKLKSCQLSIDFRWVENLTTCWRISATCSGVVPCEKLC